MGKMLREMNLTTKDFTSTELAIDKFHMYHLASAASWFTDKQ